MPSFRITNRKDILLLLLYSPGKGDAINEPISGRTRLVKMLFLFKKELLPRFSHASDINEDNFYQFFAWDFGPFSGQVYDDLTFFTLRGFIETSASDEESLPESAAEWEKWLQESGSSLAHDEVDVYEEERFTLTSDGVEFTRPYYEALGESQRQLLREFKRKLASAPLRAILQYVYSNYEEMTERSKIRDKILAKR
jgi:uncharacterized protein YwgA